MKELTYSQWHRTLGFSYFGMDLDFVEVRDNKPVAIIESSEPTTKHPTAMGNDGVFARFLTETGGFQFEVAWWSAKWLDIPAFVTCYGEFADKITVLSLQNGLVKTMPLNEYRSFLKCMEDSKHRDLISATIDPFDLVALINELKRQFPPFEEVYPYFKDKEKWSSNYNIRLEELKNKSARIRPKRQSDKTFPVKGETTYSRHSEYDKIRKNVDLDYFNLNWVEWRKDNYWDKIGRPAAFIKTIMINDEDEFISTAKLKHREFFHSKEHSWWTECSSRANVPFYTSIHCGKMEKFYVIKIHNKEYRAKIFHRNSYEEFIRSL
ncbi:hypothetical protein [Photobacterium leiognathi]|uniref:hypothetical protein n=1 Tax=Photobacterium leiognathi TaxID=553611 RepID=UPI00298241F2|nr:hypothetical protein [Photobacterium leiognathi]